MQEPPAAKPQVILEKEPDLLSFNIVAGERRYVLTADTTESYHIWSRALLSQKPKLQASRSEQLAKGRRQQLGRGTVLFDFKSDSGDCMFTISAGKEKDISSDTMFI